MSWSLEVSLKPDHNMLCVKKSPRQGPNRTRLPLKPAYHGHISWEEWKRTESSYRTVSTGYYWLDHVGWPLLHLFHAQCSCKGSHRIYLNNSLNGSCSEIECEICEQMRWLLWELWRLCATALTLCHCATSSGSQWCRGDGNLAGRSTSQCQFLTPSDRELKGVETSWD